MENSETWSPFVNLRCVFQHILLKKQAAGHCQLRNIQFGSCHWGDRSLPDREVTASYVWIYASGTHLHKCELGGWPKEDQQENEQENQQDQQEN